MPTLPKPAAPDWKKVLEVGMSATEPTRTQVRKLVNDLVAQGQIARDQAGVAVDEIVALGQARTEELRSTVRNEVAKQVRALGLVTQDDLVALERRLSRKMTSAAKKSAKPATKSRAAG